MVKVLRPYRMKLLRLAPAKFIHFGTTKEILALMCGGVEEYAGLGWSSRVASSISGSTARVQQRAEQPCLHWEGLLSGGILCPQPCKGGKQLCPFLCGHPR